MIPFNTGLGFAEASCHHMLPTVPLSNLQEALLLVGLDRRGNHLLISELGVQEPGFF